MPKNGGGKLPEGVTYKEYGLNKNLVPLYFLDDGYMAYFDYDQLNSENEPAIVAAIYDSSKYKIIEKLADDLGDFLLQMVQEQISDKN